MAIAMNDAGDAMTLNPQGQWVPTQTAHNPTTGETLALDGGQWKPVPAGANPQWSASDLGVAAMRGVPVAGGVYEQSMSPADLARAKNFDVAHPYLSTGAKMAGGVVGTSAALAALPETGLAAAIGGPMLGAARGATPLARMFSGAAGGAGLGAADAATRGENPVTGAAIGGVTGAAAPALARAVDSARGALGSALAPVNRTTPAANMMRVGNVDFPLTGPEAAGNVEGQRYLENARQGTLGPAAKAQADAFDAARGQAQAAAQQAIRSSVGGAPQTVHDAAQIAQEGVQQQQALDRAYAQAHYENFGQMQGSIAPQAFANMGGAIRNQLAQGTQPAVIDDLITPAASRMLSHIDTTLGSAPINIQNRAVPITAPTAPGTQVAGVTLQGVDQVRKQLGSIASAANNRADARASKLVMDAFDQHIQNSVDSALYSGDPNALGALQDARRIWSTYMQTYQPQGAVGGIVQKMLGAKGATPSYDDIARWMYGANNIGASGTARGVAQQLRSILGEQSPQWQAVQQGLLSKILDATQGAAPAGAQKMATILDRFLTGPGQQFAREVLPPQTTALLDQYRQIMHRITPLRGAINTSGTAYHLASMARWTLNALMTIAGHHVAGPLGAIAGYAGHNVTDAMARGLNARAVARQLYSPAAAPLYAPRSAVGPLERYAGIAARAAPIGR